MLSLKQLMAAFLVALPLTSALAADAHDPKVDAPVGELTKLIRNFHFVSRGVPYFPQTEDADPLKYGVYRGAVPISGDYTVEPELLKDLQKRMDEGVAALHDKLGVRTILDLETSDKLREAEAAAADKVHINFISKQLPPAFLAPTSSRIAQIMEILNDPGYYPIYIHCRHGQDRTGLVVGLYRHFIEGMPAADAYQEMISLGFHDIQHSQIEPGLDCYFRKATGLPVPNECRHIRGYNPD